MREIYFRGKRVPDHLKKKNDGTWVYGHLYENANGGELCIGEWKVDPDTVGQYTGRRSIDGIRVYEGDRMAFLGTKDLMSVVFWDKEEGAWGLELEGVGGWAKTNAWAKIGMVEMMQIVGSIHDEEPTK